MNEPRTLIMIADRQKICKQKIMKLRMFQNLLLDNRPGRCYVYLSYATDGSGMDHMEHNRESRPSGHIVPAVGFHLFRDIFSTTGEHTPEKEIWI